MAPLISTIDIARPQEEVFAYVTDPTTFAEWQAGVVRGSMEGGKTPTVCSKCTMTRRIGGVERESASELVKLDPPSSWAVHGIDGPIRAIVDVTVEPLDTGARSRVRIELEFEGHGIGKLLVPLVVRRQARTEMPANCARLKEQLEARSSPAAGPPGHHRLPPERPANLSAARLLDATLCVRVRWGDARAVRCAGGRGAARRDGARRLEELVGGGGHVGQARACRRGRPVPGGCLVAFR